MKRIQEGVAQRAATHLRLQGPLFGGGALDGRARHPDRPVQLRRARREGEGGVVDLCGGRRSLRLVIVSASQVDGCAVAQHGCTAVLCESAAMHKPSRHGDTNTHGEGKVRGGGGGAAGEGSAEVRSDSEGAPCHMRRFSTMRAIDAHLIASA